MDQNERQIINELFDKLLQAEQRTGPRDGDAQRLIDERLDAQPAGPYYMAQAILVQEQALHAAHDRIHQLEQALQQRPAGGGFLGGLFGGGEVPEQSPSSPAQKRFAEYQRQDGNGFLAGAMQTALGVAGGVMVGNLLIDAFSSDDALAGEGEAGALDHGEDLPSMPDDGGGDFDLDGF